MDRRRKKIDEGKKYLKGAVMFAIGLVVFTGSCQQEEKRNDNEETEILAPQETSATEFVAEKEYDKFFFAPFHFAEEIPFEVSSSRNFPEEMIEYMFDALEEEHLIPALMEIETESKLLKEAEIEEVIEKENCSFNPVSSFQYYKGNETDQWFQVSLGIKDDIVIVHQTEDGYTVIYFFRNYNGEGIIYEQALRVENYQKENCPYFIQWEDRKYIAVPYHGDNESNQIRGVSISDFTDDGTTGMAVGIGINKDGTRNICGQSYTIGNESPGGVDRSYGYAGGWPLVVEDQYK